MPRFNWKDFMNNREAQSTAAALTAAGVSRVAGLGWAPSLGLGALAGEVLGGEVEPSGITIRTELISSPKAPLPKHH